MGCVTERTVWAVTERTAGAVSQSGQYGLSHRADSMGCLTERTVGAVSQSGQYGLTEQHRKPDSIAVFVGTAQRARQYRRLHGNSKESVSPSPWEQHRVRQYRSLHGNSTESQSVPTYSEKEKHVSFFFLAKRKTKQRQLTTTATRNTFTTVSQVSSAS